jgi:hypothetical protein
LPDEPKLNSNGLAAQEKTGRSMWFCRQRLDANAPAGFFKVKAVACCVWFVQFVVMPSETFQASRWTRGNFLFPTVIEVTDQAVIRRKRSWFSKDEISISINKVASVHIKTGIIWSDILIESTGGSDPLASHGHRKADARRIRELVETAQGGVAGRMEQG